MEEVVLTEKDVPGAYLIGDASGYRLTELKRWLECHGQSKNVTLREAIEKVRACIALKIKVNPGVDGGKWYELKKRGISTQTTANGATSVTAPDNGWATFPSVDVPEMFNYGSVYHYLIESIAHFGQENNSDSSDEDSDDNGYLSTVKPLRKGKKLMQSEFVDDIQDNKNEANYFLRAHIQHSMKNEYPLNVLVVLSNVSGFVSRASCNCKSSALGRCVHVAALLLKLVEHIDKNGHRVTTPSTSKPCVWNRGKKRAKNPKPLHKTQYKSKRLADGRVYNWDPRPKEHRGSLTNRQINDFIIDLQTISASTQEESMWETSLRIFYEDYELDVEHKETLFKYVQHLEESLVPNDISAKQMSAHGAYELLGTQQQSMSPAWFQERQYRITASKCKEVCSLGDKIVEHKGNDLTWKYFHWLANNLWSPKTVQTCDMQYGLSEEPKAREAYTKATGNKVRETGLWVNRKFPYLGASPDGLATDSDGNTVGVEIKCLKILRDKSVSDLLQQHKDDTIPNEILNRQCFRITDGKLKLRENHMYYYQVQLLLMVTDLDLWDFVLHSPIGPPSVERITRNDQLLNRLRHSLSAFWHKVMAPEVFEMRVPRRLLPFVL